MRSYQIWIWPAWQRQVLESFGSLSNFNYFQQHLFWSKYWCYLHLQYETCRKVIQQEIRKLYFQFYQKEEDSNWHRQLDSKIPQKRLGLPYQRIFFFLPKRIIFFLREDTIKLKFLNQTFSFDFESTFQTILLLLINNSMNQLLKF
jgi:hypothetical protein